VGGELDELEARIVPTLLGQQLFPSDYPWNQNIADAPVAANSAAIISHIGNVHIHPDWGTDSASNGNDPLYGIPFNVVHGNTTPKVNVVIDGYSSESDIEAVPIPSNAVIEGDYQNGPNLNGAGYNSGQRGDSHMIIWDEDTNTAYELYEAERPTDKDNKTGKWEAVQETVWNMNTNQFRTLGYTSADAAGLSILAGLVRPDEGLPVSQGGQGAIDHALRFTLPSGDINPQYLYPASHEINVSSQANNKLPMGARLRLANTPQVDQLISKMGPEAQIIATAMQQYGLVLADDGSPMYVTGASGSVDANNALNLVWNMDDVLGLESLNASDFQVVDLAPTISGLSTSTGVAGATVTITGQNFSGAAGHLSVFFGATPSPSVTYVSDTQITAVVPGGTGTVDVTVQSGVNEQDTNSSNPDANANAPVFGYGTSATSPADQFTFVTQTVSGANSTVTFASPSVASGATDTVTFSIVDTNGNPIAGLPGSAFNLSLASGASTGTFSAVSPTSTPGVYTATFTGGAAGAPSSLSVSVSSVQLAEEASVQVTTGAVNGGTSIVSFASPTDASGATDLVSITVEDAGGDPISNLPSNAFAFSLSGGSSTGSFDPVTPGSLPGTYTAQFTGAGAGSASMLTCSVSGVQLSSHPQVLVTPGAPSSSRSTVSLASGTVAAGSNDLVTIVVKDESGNAVTGLSPDDFAFALAGGQSSGVFGTVSETSTKGTYTAEFTGGTAGTTSSVTVTVNNVLLASSPQLTVKTGTLSGATSTVTPGSATVASGAVDTITIHLMDAGGNPISGVAGSAFVLHLAGGVSTGSFGAVAATAPGIYTASFKGVRAGSGSTVSLTVNGVAIDSHPVIQVTPGVASATKSAVSAPSDVVNSGASEAITIVVKDSAGNAVYGLKTGDFSLAFAGGKSTATFGAVNATATPGTYTVALTGVIAGTVSLVSVKVDGVTLSSHPKVGVRPGTVSAKNCTVAFASPTVAPGKTDTLTITVADAAGNAIYGLPTSSFQFVMSGGSSTGKFAAVTATSRAGVYQVKFTAVKAGSPSDLSVIVNGVPLADDPTIQVT
jgi:hypothetical protein